MDKFQLTCDIRIVEVCIYTTKWRMHAASLHYQKIGLISESTHGCDGKCYRWYIEPKTKKGTVALIFLSWDTLNMEVLSHELNHAAVHLWTYDEEKRELSCSNDEDLCYYQSDMLCELLSMFTKEQQFKLLKIL